MIDPEIKPSKSALRFLEWFCPAKLYEGIEGDLMESFWEDVKAVGEKKAHRNFVLNSLKYE